MHRLSPRSRSGVTLIEVMIGLVILAIAAGIGLYVGKDSIFASSDTIMRAQAVKVQDACNQWLIGQPSIAAAAKQFQVVSGKVTAPRNPSAFLQAILPYLSSDAATSLQVDGAGHFTTANMRQSGAYMTVNWSTDTSKEMIVQVYLPEPR